MKEIIKTKMNQRKEVIQSRRNKVFIFSLFGVLMIALGVYAFAFPLFVGSGISPSSSVLDYKASVCTYVNRWNGEGYEGQELVGCSHNVLYSLGRNLTRDTLLYGVNSSNWEIAVCNATTDGVGNCSAPTAGAGEVFNAYEGCGLTNATASKAVIQANNGNWSLYATFTSSCDGRRTNVTRLQTSADSFFAANSFTLVTLQNLDTLTVNWTVMVE